MSLIFLGYQCVRLPSPTSAMPRPKPGLVCIYRCVYRQKIYQLGGRFPMAGKLTALQVNTLGVGFHPDGNGLYLQVTEGKHGINRSWVYRYSLNSRHDIRMRLGST